MKLPDGWKKIPLEEVAYIQTGIAKNQNNTIDSIEIPYLRVANVQDGYLDLAEIKTISIPPKKVSNYLLKKNDVLLTEGGDFDKLGRGAVWNGQIDNCIHQNHVFVVRSKPELLLGTFLSVLTGSPYGKKYFLSCSKQSTNLASINSSQLKAFPVILPPLSEQKAIADLLSVWDEAIEKTEKLIRVKEEHFNWLMRQLISEPRNSSNSKQWKRVKLEDVCKIQKGQQLNVEHMIEDGEYYVLNGGIAPSGRTDGWNTKADTITISEGGNSCGYVNYNTEQFWSGGHCYSLLGLVKDVNKHYLYFYLKMNEPILMKLRVGSGLPNIQKKDLEKFILLIPPMTEQEHIAATLSIAQQEIELLKEISVKYKTQKRGLMQKMLTGQWRVKALKTGVNNG